MGENKIRVLIVEDHTVVRKGLVSLLSTPRFNIEVVGEASDGFEAVNQSKKMVPDVILLDLVMPRKGGLQAIPDLKVDNPQVHILVLTSFSEDEDILAAINAGADGFLMKDCSPDELIQAIRSVHLGHFSLPADLARKVMSQDTQVEPSMAAELTPREKDVLEFLAKGLSNQEIATVLGISPYTVRSHVRNLLRKLNVSNRTQAALYAIEEGLVQPYDQKETPGV